MCKKKSREGIFCAYFFKMYNKISAIKVNEPLFAFAHNSAVHKPQQLQSFSASIRP